MSREDSYKIGYDIASGESSVVYYSVRYKWPWHMILHWTGLVNSWAARNAEKTAVITPLKDAADTGEGRNG